MIDDRQLILVADDEARMRRLVGDYLRRDGYAVLEAADGIEALSIFSSKPGIDLVVLDVMMPGMDGWVTLRELKGRSQVPVILLTARSQEEDEVFGLGLGSDDYIRKPVSPRILVARIAALLRRSGPPGDKDGLGRKLEGTGIDLDVGSHRLRVEGRDIEASPMEFRLLVLLVSRAGMVLSRDRILDELWGPGYAGDPRTVDTHVKNLRIKLGEAARTIGTVRGFGYRFESVGGR
ncbi:MAG TPA: response regulator transcription factor [Rectinemataceae bacterium]|nr:response regulator transcription factor [Rectinemataceae bacterium]